MPRKRGIDGKLFSARRHCLVTIADKARELNFVKLESQIAGLGRRTEGQATTLVAPRFSLVVTPAWWMIDMKDDQAPDRQQTDVVLPLEPKIDDYVVLLVENAPRAASLSTDVELVNGLHVRKTGGALPFGPKLHEYEVLLDEDAARAASEYTGPPGRPQDVPIMSLPAAIDCIASKAATDRYDREMYEATIGRVLDSLLVGDLSASWRTPYGQTVPVPKEEFRGVKIAHTYQIQSELTGAILDAGPVLDLVSNQSLVGGRVVGRELTVDGRDIARLFFPFPKEDPATEITAPARHLVEHAVLEGTEIFATCRYHRKAKKASRP